MPLGVSYMGTKRHLAPNVAALISDCRAGPVLDLFSGMCAVASAVGSSRQVWTNDLQHFAHQVATAYFCSNSAPPDELTILDAVANARQSHFKVLAELSAAELADEDSALADGTIVRLPGRKGGDTNGARSGQYDLFLSQYAGAYFGYRQAMEIDALRKAIDTAGVFDAEARRWLVLALCRAASRCATTTGHFAQPLRPNSSNQKKFLAQRRRSIFAEWHAALSALHPQGGRAWRSGNRAFRSEALNLLDELKKSKKKPAVVYADPPYTDDQYSRYYHIYETIILYDYPAASGMGLYRGDRAVSDFSLKAKVSQSIEALIEKTAGIGADLVLTYPQNGLMRKSHEEIPRLLASAFRGGISVARIDHVHSTMGASKGVSKEPVVEIIYTARH